MSKGTDEQLVLSPLNTQKKPFLLRSIRGLRRTKYLQLMMIPGLAYFIIFHYVPMYGLLIAFKDYNSLSGIWGSEWIGFTQFQKFFNHPNFYRLVRNTFLLNLYGLFWSFPAPIILALFLNEVRVNSFKRVVQTISYLPNFISTVAVVGMVSMLFSTHGGYVNVLLERFFGIDPHYFMGDVRWFRTLYIGSDVWQKTGFGAIIFLAALSGIDPQLYESATIDGANRFQQIFHITLPGIKATIMILLILNVGNMMTSSTEKVLLMQMPLTYEVSDVIGTYVYRRGLQYAEYSYGTAVGLFNSIINVIMIVSANLISRRVTKESLW